MCFICDHRENSKKFFLLCFKSSIVSSFRSVDSFSSSPTKHSTIALICSKTEVRVKGSADAYVILLMRGGDLLPRFPQYGSLVPRVQSAAGREYIWRGCEPPGVPQYPLHLRARWRRSNASFLRRKRNEALRPCPPDTPQHYP